MKDKEHIGHSSHTITEYFKTVKPRRTAEAQISATQEASRIPDSKVRDGRQLKGRKGQVTRSTHDIKPIKEHTREDLQQDKHLKFGMDENEDDVQSENDERELSLIIDRILNMDMNGRSKQPCITKENRNMSDVNDCESKEGFVAIQNLGSKSSELIKADEKTNNDESPKNIHVLQPPSLFERASKRLSHKCKKKVGILENNTTGVEQAKSKSVLAEKHLCNRVIGDKKGTDVGNIAEGIFREIEETLQTPKNVDLERRVQFHNVSTDMFENSLGDDTLARIFEDTMTEDTSAGMLQDILALDSSLSNSNTLKFMKGNRVTGPNSDFTPCTSEDRDLLVSSVEPNSHLHESMSSCPTSVLPPPVSNLNIHYLETDCSGGSPLEEHTGGKLIDKFIYHGNIHKRKQSNIPVESLKSVYYESVETEQQDTASLLPLASSPECIDFLERELEDVSVKLSSQPVGVENKHTHKQTSAAISSLSTPPIFKVLTEKEFEDTSIALQSTLVHLEKSHKENQCNVSLSTSICESVEVFQETPDSLGNAAPPLDAADSCCSANKYSKHVRTQETRLDGYYQGAYHENQIQRCVHEPLPGGSEHKTDVLSENDDEVVNHNCSPQQSPEIYQSHQTPNLTQFCLTEGKTRNDDEMEKPSVSPSSKNPGGPDGNTGSFDPFSPEVVTLTLAQRLRQKCSDKQFRKLLDDLG